MDEDLTPSTEEQFRHIQSWKYTFIASGALLIFDLFITLEDEVEHIWQRQRSMFTYIWISLRYGPVLFLIAATYIFFQTSWEPELQNWSVVPAAMMLCVLVTIHVVFALRTYALYGRARWVLYLFAFGLTIETAAMVWAAMRTRQTHLPKGYGCMPGTPRTVPGRVVRTVPFLFNATVFGLTLRRTVQFIRNRKDIPIVQVMIQDGVVFFGLIVLCYGSNVILYLVGLKNVNSAAAIALTIICTQRIVFNLRNMSTAPSQDSPQDTTSTQPWQVANVLSQPTGLLDTLHTDMGDALSRSQGQGRPQRAQPTDHEHHGVLLNDFGPGTQQDRLPIAQKRHDYYRDWRPPP
ncbi:hypothetical protein BKA62DRAFT_721443 [Auriculariales sp. MPI-PUGE-AT-0066]|nr:hypothetical protein BKA62DRAFT_721443 [Auriculariales sp. MPI-PUGE-AT-0066]